MLLFTMLTLNPMVLVENLFRATSLVEIYHGVHHQHGILQHYGVYGHHSGPHFSVQSSAEVILPCHDIYRVAQQVLDLD